MLEQRERGEDSTRPSTSSWSSSATVPRCELARRAPRATGRAAWPRRGHVELALPRAAGRVERARGVPARGHGLALASGAALPEPAAGLPWRRLAGGLPVHGQNPMGDGPGHPTWPPSWASSSAWKSSFSRRRRPPRSPRSTSTRSAQSREDAARSLDQLAKLTRTLEEAGLIEQHGGRTELTPQGSAGSGKRRFLTCSRT